MSRCAIRIVHAACPVCAADAGASLVRGLRDVEHGNEGSYEIARCRSCGFVYLAERPSGESLPDCYGEEYHVHAPVRGNALLRTLFGVRYRLRHRRVRRVLGREPASVLEVGCGDAQSLVHLERRLGDRCRLVGVEVDASRILLPPGSRIQLHSGGVEGMPAEGRYDAILLYDVLEHLQDPVATLVALGERLAPGGALFILIPNWDSLWRRAFPHHWGGLQIPRHQLFFDRSSIRGLLERTGYRVRTVDNVFDPGDLSVALCNWLSDRLHLRTKPRRAWFYYPLLLASAPVVLLQNLLLGQSGEIEAVADRPGK